MTAARMNDSGKAGKVLERIATTEKSTMVIERHLIGAKIASLPNTLRSYCRTPTVGSWDHFCGYVQDP
jgi:hypothetical protein